MRWKHLRVCPKAFYKEWTLFAFFFSNDIKRATENFSVNVLDIKREEPDRHEENTDEKDNKNGEVFRIGKCRGKLRVEKVLAEEDVEAGDGGNGGDTDTEISGKPKRDET